MHDPRLCNAENLSAFYADLNARIATRIIADLETPGIDPNRLDKWIDVQGHVTDALHDAAASAEEIRYELGYDADGGDNGNNGDVDGNPGPDANEMPPACNCFMCRLGAGFNGPVDLGGGIRMQRIDPADLPKELLDILNRRFGIRPPTSEPAPTPAPANPTPAPTPPTEVSRAVDEALHNLAMLQKCGWISREKLDEIRSTVLSAVDAQTNGGTPPTDRVG